MEREELINYDYYLGFSKSSNFLNNIVKKIIFYYSNDFKNYVFSKKNKLSIHEYNYLSFLTYLKENNKNSSLLLIDNYLNIDYDEDVLFLMLIILKFKGIDLYDNFYFKDKIKNDLFLIFKLFCERNYIEAFNRIIKIFPDERYKTLYLILKYLIFIKNNLIEEAKKLLLLLKKRISNNLILIFLEAEIYFSKKDFLKTYKMYDSHINYVIKNEVLRKNFLFLSKKINKIDKFVNIYLKYNDSIKFSEEEIFEIAKYFHENGDFKFAYELYNKVNPKKFPINKMISIMYLQVDNYEKFIEHLEKEVELRGEDFDIKRLKKYYFYYNRFENINIKNL